VHGSEKGLQLHPHQQSLLVLQSGSRNVVAGKNKKKWEEEGRATRQVKTFGFDQYLSTYLSCGDWLLFPRSVASSVSSWVREYPAKDVSESGVVWRTKRSIGRLGALLLFLHRDPTGNCSCLVAGSWMVKRRKGELKWGMVGWDPPHFFAR